LCVGLLPLKLQLTEAAASDPNSITADTSVVRAVYLLKISKGGDFDCRHGKLYPNLLRSVSVSVWLSFWSYPVLEMVTSALTLLSVYIAFQRLRDHESTEATDVSEMPELLV
jgi:hypothetical protein